MAIDTAAKRQNVAGMPCLPLGPGVTPDAAKPVAWRQQAGWGYGGIAVSEAAAVEVVGHGGGHPHVPVPKKRRPVPILDDDELLLVGAALGVVMREEEA